MANLKGINLALQTPFRVDGSIDFKMWEVLIDQYIDAGVHGLVMGSGTGQHPYLSEQECNQLYEIGAKRINGRCNIICQTSALVIEEILRRSNLAEEIGADALMILPPYLEGPSNDDGLFAFYEHIDAKVNVDIVGYNIPQATGITVSPELYQRLIQLDNFAYIKDSAGDLTTHQAYLQCGGQVLNGCDTTTIFALFAGAHGVIWGGANYMPYEAVALYDYIELGKYTEALDLWRKMIPSLTYIWRNNYIQLVLEASRIRGYGLGNVRAPLQALCIEEKTEIKKLITPLITNEN